jgi:indole-3-glycerol phosphate synthase
MNNILNQIVEKKRERLITLKKNANINSILDNIKNFKNFYNFKNTLKKRSLEKKISIIAEIKKASPSAGMLVDKFDPVNLASIYDKNGASFLSVLTEEDFFLGNLDYIKNIKEFHNLPILCKDFFIDTYQLALSKSFGADCILIILAAVDKSLAKDLYQAAKDLKLSTLIEVHSEKEADLALYYEDSIIGINNRNLKTLEVSLDTTIKLAKILKSHPNPLVCESGISTSDDMKLIIEKTNINNFLIGESLLTSNDIGQKLKEFTEITL